MIGYEHDEHGATALDDAGNLKGGKQLRLSGVTDAVRGGFEEWLLADAMKDGLMYEIPKYVARFLNGTDVSARAVDGHKDDNKFIGTCSYGVYDFKVDAGVDPKTSADLLPVAQISNFTRRYGFQSMDFGGAR